MMDRLSDCAQSSPNALRRCCRVAQQTAAAAPPAAATTDDVAGDRQILGQSRLFEDISSEGLQEALGATRARVVRKDEFCFLQGDGANTMYVLLSGTIKLVQSGADGHQVIVHLATPPEPFGHMGVLNGGIHKVSAQAVCDSRILAWDLRTMRRLMQNYPALETNLMRLLAVRVEEEWERFHVLLTASLEQRLARALLQLTHAPRNTAHSGRPIMVSLLHQDLADLTGTNIYTVSRILSRWKRSRLIETCRGRILVWSLPALEEIVGEPVQ
jgi:CRP/FNR family transcriptional regulator, nitrogen oxide reductase regulator